MFSFEWHQLEIAEGRYAPCHHDTCRSAQETKIAVDLNKGYCDCTTGSRQAGADQYVILIVLSIDLESLGEYCAGRKHVETDSDEKGQDYY